MQQVLSFHIHFVMRQQIEHTKNASVGFKSQLISINTCLWYPLMGSMMPCRDIRIFPVLILNIQFLILFDNMTEYWSNPAAIMNENLSHTRNKTS